VLFIIGRLNSPNAMTRQMGKQADERPRPRVRRDHEGIAVPGQRFTTTEGGTLMVLWDMGERYVEVELDQKRIATFDDFEALRTAGQAWLDEQGRQLDFYAVKGSLGTEMVVRTGGVDLEAHPVEFFRSPALQNVQALGSQIRPPGPRDGLSLDIHGRLMVDGQKIDQHLIDKPRLRKIDQATLSQARFWAGFISAFPVLLYVFVAVQLLSGNEGLLSSGIAKAFILGGLIFDSFSLFFAFRKKPRFGPAMCLVVIRCIANPIIGWIIMYFAIKRLSAGNGAAEDIRYNAWLLKHATVE
jgi:hypothetical protein